MITSGENFRGIYSNVIFQNRNSGNEFSDIHGALMPLKLAEKIITQFSKENDLVLEPFAGIGTTLIACMSNNRRCYSIEKEPVYCEKTIERYLDYVIGKPNIKIIRNEEVITYDAIRKLCKKTQMNLFDF